MWSNSSALLIGKIQTKGSGFARRFLQILSLCSAGVNEWSREEMQLLKAQKRGLLSSKETLINYQEALRFMLASEAQSWWWWLSSSFPILLIYVRHPSSLLVSVISTTHKGYQTYQHHSFSPRLQDLIWKCLFLGPELWFFTWERFLVISLLDCRCLAQCSFRSPK